jgi:RHS repeat-associated protein
LVSKLNRAHSAGGVGGLLARTTYGQELPGAPTTEFYHADGNGNVTALLYPNQQLAAKYLYDPFGNMLAMSGPLRNFNKYRFASKEWNDSLGVYYYGYRFYDQNLQRWLNRDPALELGFGSFTSIRGFPHDNSFSMASDGLDVYEYEYVANDPADNLDLMGLNTHTFTKDCSPAEMMSCEMQCTPYGVKSCTVTEVYEDVPGKPPKLKSKTKNCTCNDNKPPSWKRFFDFCSQNLLFD